MRKSLLYMIGVAVLLSSCHYKDLDEAPLRRNLQIRFLWDEAPDARPESMLMYVFSGDAQPVVLPFSDINGGPATLAPATYQLIAMNDGTELLTRGVTWSAFEVYAQEVSLPAFSPMFAPSRAVPVAGGTEDQRYFMEPDSLQTDGIGTVVLTEQTETVDFLMHEAVKRYRFLIRGVDNLDHVTTVTATVSGMSESWLAGPGLCSDTQCMLPFALQADDGGGELSGHVDSFGHCPGTEIHRHLLTVYFQMDNGQKFYLVSDVTDQLHDPVRTDGGDDPVIVEGQSLPYDDSPAGKGMLDPEVEEWTEVSEDIYL